MDCDDLARFGIHSNPYPLLVAFRADETPYFVGFDSQGIQGFGSRANHVLQVYAQVRAGKAVYSTATNANNPVRLTSKKR